jgi:phospholipase D-like protein
MFEGRGSMTLRTGISMDPVQAVLLVVLSVVLLLWSLWDLSRPERQVVGHRKWVWLVIILIVGLPGQLLYLLLARRKRTPAERV